MWLHGVLVAARGLFRCGSGDEESACNVGDLDSVPALGRSPGKGNGYSLQYSFLGNPMDRGACQAIAHGVAKSRTWLKYGEIHREKLGKP